MRVSASTGESLKIGIVPLDAPGSKSWTPWLTPDPPMTTLVWVATCTFPEDPVVKLQNLVEDMTRKSSSVA